MDLFDVLQERLLLADLIPIEVYPIRCHIPASIPLMSAEGVHRCDEHRRVHIIHPVLVMDVMAQFAHWVDGAVRKLLFVRSRNRFHPYVLHNVEILHEVPGASHRVMHMNPIECACAFGEFGWYNSITSLPNRYHLYRAPGSKGVVMKREADDYVHHAAIASPVSAYRSSELEFSSDRRNFYPTLEGCLQRAA